MEIRKQVNGDIHLVQHKYLTEVLAKFQMSNCREVITPLPPGSRLSDNAFPQSAAEREEMKEIPLAYPLTR